MLVNTDSLISSTYQKLDLLGVGLTTQYASVSWIYAGYRTTLQKCVTVFCHLILLSICCQNSQLQRSISSQGHAFYAKTLAQ